MSESIVYFDGQLLEILEREEVSVDFDFQETTLLSGKLRIDAIPEPKFARVWTCYTDDFAKITNLLSKIGRPYTLQIDGVDYTNCYIAPPFSYRELIFGSGQYTYTINIKRHTA